MTIRIRMTDEDRNSTLVGVEKAPGSVFIAKTMNPVGGFISSRHKSEDEALDVRDTDAL
jgi:hypothetical protein